MSDTANYLRLKEDGSDENRLGATGQIGTFAAGASRLTLNRDDGDKNACAM